MHVVAGLYLIAVSTTWIQKSAGASLLPVVLLLAVALISLTYGFARKRVDARALYNRPIRVLQLVTFACAALLLYSTASAGTIIALSVWVVVAALLLVSEKRLFGQAALRLVDTGITVPGALADHLIPWSLIESVVVRADFATILRRDQKFVQLEVAAPLDNAQLDALNRYSQQQIAATPAVEEPV
ncbi:MAG: hypothetical protein JWP27_1852 [Flaviaesturariibacter sp.]|nr:hypothetical protein [Flaviaesturariibacter sp.]